MQRIINIRRIDMFVVGTFFRLKISRLDGSQENIVFIIDTEDGKIKLDALQKFIKIFKLESKCFLIEM